METPTVSVSQAIALCNAIMGELKFSIEGEVANFTINRGKFVFFDLKDEEQEAKLGCFMMAHQLSTPIENGMRAIVEGRAGLYQKSGQFRISVTEVKPTGQGSLQRSYELLLRSLSKEGLFEPGRKRPLPQYVSKVGIISSDQAAGFGDFKTIAFQRLPGVEFILANVAVQGKLAESEICAAFAYLNSHYTLDAIVLIRGGGSLEDLQAFNSERVARAIVASKAPVIVGVGHERDITIADHVADLRGSTPSNVAQLLLPTTEEIRGRIAELTRDGELRVISSISQRREYIRGACYSVHQRLLHCTETFREQTSALIRTIDAISPGETLKRGYSITFGPNGKPLTNSADVHVGDHIKTRLHEGVIESVLR